ncbi:MAG: glycosyltransferase, partial [Bacteroidota bacterium]
MAAKVTHPPINILFVTSWYPNRLHAQDGNFVQAFAEAVGSNHQVTVLHVTEGTKQHLERRPENWGKVIQATYSRARTRVQRIIRRSKAWRVAIQEVDGEYFDLIHAHVLIDGGIVAARLAHKRGIPFVISAHSHRYLEPWPVTRFLELWLARRAAHRAAFLLPVSPSLQKGMQQHDITGTYRVLPNLVDDALFHPPKERPPKPFTFLHVSDFSANKRVPALIEYFAEVARKRDDIVLRLAGNELPPELPAFIRSLHLRPHQIVLSGPHSRFEIADLMRSADAFLLNSQVETQSVVLIEALLSGLPCIATRCGGPEDILDQPEFGSLVPVNDRIAYLRAMQKIVATPPANRVKIHDLARVRYGR